MNYTVDDEKKKCFADVYMLGVMVRDEVKIPLYLEDKDRDLEPVLEHLMMKKYIEIKDNEWYTPTESGKKVLQHFSKRYQDYLRNYDVFCAVDLAEGAFAFARYFDCATEEEWKQYIQLQRWDDLRVAVAAYKGIDPVEIVFMSFLQEGRFGNRGEGWQFDLLLGSVWDEILEICNSAVAIGELEYTDEDGTIGSEAVIRDIISQGAALNIELRSREKGQRMRMGIYDERGNDLLDTHSVDDPKYVASWWTAPVF